MVDLTNTITNHNVNSQRLQSLSGSKWFIWISTSDSSIQPGCIYTPEFLQLIPLHIFRKLQLVFYLVWSTYPAGMTDNKCGIDQINQSYSEGGRPNVPQCLSTAMSTWYQLIHKSTLLTFENQPDDNLDEYQATLHV
jgi:hypothetical protein